MIRVKTRRYSFELTLVIDTPFGRLDGLICWENYMPLARMAMYAQGVDIRVTPTWDCAETWVPTLQHIATRAGCMSSASHRACAGLTSEEIRGSLDGGDEDWMCRGRSAIVGPMAASSPVRPWTRRASSTPTSTSLTRVIAGGSSTR